MDCLRKCFSNTLGTSEREVVFDLNFITGNLWVKESNEDGGLYVDLLKDMSAYPSVLPYVSRKHKNNKVAAKLLSKGIQKAARNNHLSAVTYLNESICFSEIGTEILGTVYANRAACFFVLGAYEKCVADIELAIAAKCPEELIPELLERKEVCLKAMETDPLIEECSPQLSFEEDERFPSMANVIEIKYNEEFGRHITAKRNIDVGKVILIEKPFLSTTIKESKFCNHCLKRVSNLIPCNRCTDAMYCNSTCLESDIFHETECGIIYDSDTTSILTQHIQRSLIAAINIFPTTEDLMEFVEEAVKDKSNKVPSSISDNKSKYYSFLRLHMHWSLQRLNDFSKMIHPLYHYILSVSSLKEKFNTEGKQRFLMHLIGQHYCNAVTNGFKPEKKHHIVYINVSYFNHSCSPNVIHYLHRDCMICVVARPIKKDEQLYIPYTFHKMTGFRRTALLENWGVFCECERCEPCSQSISNDKKLFPSISTDFDIILNALKDKSYKSDRTKYFVVKEMLINFLRKYGRLHWNDKIELVTEYFVEALRLRFEFFAED